MNERQAWTMLAENNVIEKAKRYEAAFQIWLDANPHASDTAKQLKRVQLWRKWVGE